MLNRAIEYCNYAIGNDDVPKYVQLQCKEFLKVVNGETKYHIDEKKLNQMTNLFKIIIMPTGVATGKPVYDSLVGFQCLFFVAVWCTYHNDDTEKRRYKDVLLEVARKNGKTFLIALLFILALMTEPKFSRLFSVAPDGQLSREVYTLVKQFISMTPKLQLYHGKLLFKTNRDKMICNATESEYTPLNYSTSRMDGRMVSIALLDEVGALPSSYAISAMKLGGLPVKNNMVLRISTKYSTLVNPFEDELLYFKNVLDGVTDDDTAFSLIFEPNEDIIKEWEFNDRVLKQASPLALEVPSILDEIKTMREQAIQIPSQRGQFLCKMCNIISPDTDTETYLDVNQLTKCRVDKVDWKGKKVYLGLDLSQTTDNTAVAMVARNEYGKLQAFVMPFIPTDNVKQKTKVEKVDYQKYIDEGICIACGDDVISYGVVEDWIRNIEQTFDCSVEMLGYDRYNCISTADKLQADGICCVEVKQHSSVLHPATKLLKEEIIGGNFEYERNELLEINFQNAKVQYDTNMNMYVNKKKSKEKVDMVVALINAVYMLQQNEQDNVQWVVQV